MPLYAIHIYHRDTVGEHCDNFQYICTSIWSETHSLQKSHLQVTKVAYVLTQMIAIINNNAYHLLFV